MNKKPELKFADVFKMENISTVSNSQPAKSPNVSTSTSTNCNTKGVTSKTKSSQSAASRNHSRSQSESSVRASSQSASSICSSKAVPVNATNTSTNQMQRSSLPQLGRGLEPGQVVSLDDLEIDLDSPPLVARQPMKVMRVIIR
jgi:hypothetical protein